MDTFTFADKIDNAFSELTALQEERKAIMAQVDEALEANAEARKAAAERMQAACDRLTEEIELSHLSDPLMYSEVSRVLWEASVNASRKFMARLFGGLYVFPDTRFYGRAGNPLLSLTVAVPAQANPEVLARTADTLEPILREATIAFGDQVVISVFEDSLSAHQSYYITYDEEDDVFMLNDNYRSENTSLLEILKRVPTYQ